MRASRHGAGGGPWHRSLTIVFQRCEEDPRGHHILRRCPQRVTGGCWHLPLRVSTWTWSGQARGSRRAWSPPCHCGTGEWGSQHASPSSGLPLSRRQRGKVLKMKHTPQIQVKKATWHILQLGLKCEVYNLHVQKEGPSGSETMQPLVTATLRARLPTTQRGHPDNQEKWEPRPHLNKRGHRSRGSGRGRGWAPTSAHLTPTLWGGGLPISCSVSICKVGIKALPQSAAI